MVWESFLSGSDPTKSLLLAPANLKVGQDNFMFVYSGGCLHAISSVDGEVIWKKDLITKGFQAQHLILPSGSDVLYAVGFSGSSQFITYAINTKDGELLKHHKVSFPGSFSGDISLVSSDKLVALDSTESFLVLLSITGEEINLQQTHVSDLVQGYSGTPFLLPSKLSGVFAVKMDALLVVIKMTDEGKLELMEKIDHGTAISDALTLSEAEQAFVVVQQRGSEIDLSVKGVTKYV